MATSSVTNPTTTSTTTGVAATAKTDSTTTTADYNSFLLLLTTQMKNQDPTQPMDATEQISQLAQFSSVEQQVKMNDKLSSLLTMMTTNDLDRGANYLGKTITAQTGAIAWDGDNKPSFTYQTTPDAKSSVAVIKDSLGKVVKEFTLESASATGKTATWDGLKADGSEAAEGNYSISIKNVMDTSDSTKDVATNAVTSARVVSAVNDSAQGVLLTLSNGKTIPIGGVLGVTAGAAATSS